MVIAVIDTRNCEQCGTSFVPRREHARFCSARCRVTWNRQHVGDPPTAAGALGWTITAMQEAIDRLLRAGRLDQPHAFAVISEAVWWVTMVDATLVRYHPDAYDVALASRGPEERLCVEGTFGGLRFVRNWMGYHADHADFIRPQPDPDHPDAGPVAGWTWRSLPEPVLAGLPARGQEWEMTRYREYQAHLAGRPVGETFRGAAAFLSLASEGSLLGSALRGYRRPVASEAQADSGGHDMTETAWQAAESAAAVLGPEADVLASVDSAGLAQATLAVLGRAALQPGPTAVATARFWTSVALAGPVATARWLGMDLKPPVQVPDSDKRFADPTWAENPAFFAMRQGYLAASQLAHDLLEAGASEPVDDAKATLATGFLLDALAPTNFLFTNPAALKRVLETGGASVARGTRNLVSDLLTNGGRPRQVDTRPFRVGENLAATPGKIVFKNDLMELIQYAPQTEQVRAVPVLASPPWINKYYVMDLAPGRSFLEWAVQHERTVFAISYRNPDPSMSGVTLDDYLIHGPREALDVIGEITGAPKIDIIGLCLGGALTAMLAAYLTEKGDDRIGSITLLNTLLDYSEPGVLGTFTDEKTVARLERQMAATGVLEGSQMAGTFDILRANDLIFNYVVSSWLMGQDPPAFDILAWNGDSTRMPATMHSFYLRSLYMRNELARGELELAGQRLSLSDVRNDTYVVGAINDHIVPWHGSYKTGGLMGGNVRYVLSSGGHIAGIVNPPGPKAWYEAAGYTGPLPEAWREANSKHRGSWWEDWTTWADDRAGERIKPPAMGSKRHRAIGDAPGEYVFG